MDSGSWPEKLVSSSIKVSSWLPEWNSGKYPLRYGLYRILRKRRLGKWNIPRGSSPCNPQSLRNRDDKDDKFAMIWGTLADMFTSERWSTSKLVNASTKCCRPDFWSFKEFDLRSRETSLESSKISSGIWPEKEECERSRSNSLERFRISEGILELLKSLSARFSLLRWTSGRGCS